jgi:ABC-type transport system involved in multi-copper enzyme maturation permease subunit
MKALKCDLNKSILNIGYVGAVLLTTLLCFTAKAYTDPNTAKIYTVFECIAKLDKQLFADDYSFSSYLIFAKGMSGYMAMFLPIIAAFPFMTAFCAERNGGSMRFNITRTGSLRYYLSKFCSAFLCGGSAVLFGYIIFGVIVRIIFPSLSQYELSADDLSFVLVNNKDELTGVLRYMLSAFLYGAISTMPALFISSFCKNPYLITCVPFMLNYVLTTMLNRIIDANLFNENFDFDRANAFYPSSVTNFLYIQSFDRSAKWITAVNCSGAIVTLLGFIIVMNLRKDKGV